MNNIIRKYKINTLIPSLNYQEIRLFNYIKNITSDLTKYHINNIYSTVYDELKYYIFYMDKQGKCIFQVGINKNTLKIRYVYLIIL